MKKIRILHVFGSLNMGGAETLIMNLYRNIDREKIQFDFAVHGNEKGIYEDEIKKLGGRIYHFHKYKLCNHISYVKEWNNFFKSHKEYKIVHGHMRSTASIYLKIAKKYEIVTICHSHSTSNGKGIKAVVKKILQSSITTTTDYFLSCSKSSAKWLYGNDILNSPNCYVINNFIDTKKYIYSKEKQETMLKELNIENKFIIGQIGRFVDVKNHMFTLKLFKEYLKIHDNAFLILIGSGELENTIIDKIKEYEVTDNVIILNNRNDVNELMQIMDVFIMPSKYEGLPLTLVEAQAESIPCIVSTNVNAGFIVDELINQISLDAPISEWIECIEKQKNNKKVDRSKEIIEAGFDAKENSKWFEKFYKSLLD